MNSLVDFLAASGLRTTGRKIELVAQDFAANDIYLPILASSVEQQSKLNTDYQNCLKFFTIADPLLVDNSAKSDEIFKKWPKSVGGRAVQIKDFLYSNIRS